MTGLLGGLRIVGFDLNPFAVLMAQVNYAAQILPLYAQALAAGGSPTLSIPVVRTDSLRQEYREGDTPTTPSAGATQGQFHIDQDEKVTVIRTELPVQVAPGQFFNAEIPVPRLDYARQQGWIGRAEEYFTALRVLFDAVGTERTAVADLREALRRAGLTHAGPLATYMQPAGDRLRDAIRQLRQQYNDGRFLKTLADLALALILKNDLSYDYVVGNPPYIRVQEIPPAIRAAWEQWYAWADGNFDAYIPFLERAIHVRAGISGPHVQEWLALGGRLGFIASDRFLLANYATQLRQHLPQDARIQLLVDLRDRQVFADALNYPAILVLQRIGDESTPPGPFPAIRVFADPQRGLAALLQEIRQLAGGVRAGDLYLQGHWADAFPMAMADLAPAGWLIIPPAERAVLDRIEAAAAVFDPATCPACARLPLAQQLPHPHPLRLEHLTLTQSGGFSGYSTSDDAVQLLRLLEDRGATLLLEPRGAAGDGWQGPQTIEIERELVRPWLFGRDIERWYIGWRGWYVFFPYEQITALEKHGKAWVPVTRYRLMPAQAAEQQFRTRYMYQDPFPCLDRDYPLAWQYITNPFIEARLRKRDGNRFAIGKRDAIFWYGATYPRSIDRYFRPKVMIQGTAPANNSVADSEGKYIFAAASGGQAILPNPAHLSSDLLSGLLNAPVLDFYLKHISPVFKGRSYSYSDQYIKQLPIRLPTDPVTHAHAMRIAQQAHLIEEQTQRLRTKQAERAAFPVPQARLFPQYSRYPLGQLVQGTPRAQTLVRNQVSFAQQLLGGGVAMTFGQSSLGFPHQALADVVVAWMRVQTRATLSVADVLALEVPSSAAGCRRLLAALAALEADIAQLQGDCLQHEADLADIVADYYGLTSADRQVLTDFLGRF